MEYLPGDFDWFIYNRLNPDLRDIVDGQPVFYDEEHSKIHYLRHGIFEGRNYKMDLPLDFIWQTYNRLNPDLRDIVDGQPVFYDEEHSKIHYLRHGIFEGRNYKIDLPLDFDWQKYLELNTDLNIQYEEQSISHYLNDGFFENRHYKYDNSIIIYVLCYNQETYENALINYKKYHWAKPICIKYQNYQFENAFWKQLKEISNEWRSCEMVGTISHSAYKKINLEIVNDYIINKKYYPNTYLHFYDTFHNINTVSHPDLNQIWNDTLIRLNLIKTTESCCNYFMCTPYLMKSFINWYLNTCFHLLNNNPLIFGNSTYSNVLSKTDLVNLWGKDYYPNFPFVCERLNKSFFVTNYKMVFLISHEKSNKIFSNELNNIERIYQNKNIRTIQMYLPDIERDNINIVSYIGEKARGFNCSPIVICDTLECYNIVKPFVSSNILTYWYIHEFYEENYPFIKNDSEIFRSSVNIIFTNEYVLNLFEKILPVVERLVVISNDEEMVLKLLSKPIIHCR